MGKAAGKLTEEFVDRALKLSQVLEIDKDLMRRIDLIHKAHPGKVALCISGGGQSIVQVDAVFRYNKKHGANIPIISIDMPDYEGKSFADKRGYVEQLQNEHFPINVVHARDESDKNEALMRYTKENDIEAVLYGIRRNQEKRMDRELVEKSTGIDGHEILLYNTLIDWSDAEVQQTLEAFPDEWRHKDEGAKFRNGVKVNDLNDEQEAPQCDLQKRAERLKAQQEAAQDGDDYSI